MTVHRFAYMTEPTRGDDRRPHELRDGDAYCLLLPALIALGYQAGSTLINHPLNPSVQDTSIEDLGFLDEDDLLVVTSRPPIHDTETTMTPKQSKPSKTEFEQATFFPGLSDYLTYCSRSQIMLHQNQAKLLKSGYRNRWNVNFFIKPNSKKARWESAYDTLDGSRGFEPFQVNRTTAAYMIHTPPLKMPSGRGPRVLLSFGLSGTVGCAFAHQLSAQKLPEFRGLLEDILRAPGFAMVEITVTRDVPGFYTSLDFSDDWEYKLITKRPIRRQMPASEVYTNDYRSTKRENES